MKEEGSKQEMILQEEKIVFYTNHESRVTVDVYFVDENFWMPQKTMATLFNADIRTINEHLSNIYNSEELLEEATIRKFRIVQKEGNRNVTREIQFYNLDAIIAVGYRVNSKEATGFRRWATETLKEFIIKGFVLNDEMLTNGKAFGKDYFDELLERIREIRASERRFYQKITDIYAECSIDYDANAEVTKKFYAIVQNKLHYSITGKTAAEIIAGRVNIEKEHMGLTTWKNAPDGKILKCDVTVAKNYLNQEEIDLLNRLVTMYLDYAEMQAKKQKPMTMDDWVKRLDAFLDFNEYEVLQHSGHITSKVAKALAEDVYSKFRIQQDRDYLSDFDKQIIEKVKKRK